MFFQRIWRIGRRLHRMHVPLLPGFFRILCRILFSADVPVQVDIPPGVVFMHNGLATVVHTKVRFRGQAIVFHGVTLGHAKALVDGEPVVGDKVMIGAGAAILGPIRIGDRCIVGANAVVTRDVPDGHMALGNPAVLRPVDQQLIDHLFPPG